MHYEKLSELCSKLSSQNFSHKIDLKLVNVYQLQQEHLL